MQQDKQQFQHKTGYGSLFKNQKKLTSKSPDYQGKGCTESGEQVNIAGWVREGKKGKYLSLRITPIDVQGDQQAANHGQSGVNSSVNQSGDMAF